MKGNDGLRKYLSKTSVFTVKTKVRIHCRGWFLLCGVTIIINKFHRDASLKQNFRHTSIQIYSH